MFGKASKKVPGPDYILEAGTQRFPFAFQLPHGLPPTFGHASLGSLTYKLKGHVGLSAKLKIDPRKEIDIGVVGSLNLSMVQRFSPALQAKGEKSFLFSKGKCHMTVTMNTGAAYQGATLTGMIALRNDSNKTITQVKGRLLMNCTWRAEGRARSYSTKFGKFVLCAQPVTSGQTFETQFQFVVPHDAALACSVHSGTNDILRIEHFLAIVADASFAKDLEILVPLFLSPTPGQLEPFPTPAMQLLQPIEFHPSLQMAQAEAVAAVAVIQVAQPVGVPMPMQVAQPMGAPPAYGKQQSFGAGAVHAPAGAPPQQFVKQEPFQSASQFHK